MRVTKASLRRQFVACLFFAAITKIKICFDSENGSVGNFFSREKGPRVKLLVEPWNAAEAQRTGSQARPRLGFSFGDSDGAVLLKMYRSIIRQLRTLLVIECLNYLSKASNL